MKKYLGPRARAKKKLETETRKAGGIKARSASHEARMAVYRGIAELFKTQNPLCDCCDTLQKAGIVKLIWANAKVNWTDDVHHMAGRDGILLFDVRKFKAACRFCHDWCQDNPQEAIKLGLSLPRK